MARKPARAAAPRRSLDLSVVTVAVAAFIAFLPALSGGFVWDDFDYVKNNPILHAHGAAVLAKIASLVVVGNYHPMTMASLAIDNALFGPGPFVFHLTNVLIHAINAVLVLRLLLALGMRRDAAWAGAVLWAVHPLRVESVAWISGRKDVLFVCFFLAALLAYLRHVKEDAGPRRAFGLSLAFFACSLLSKGSAVAFVPVLFLIDWFLDRRPTTTTLKEKVPFVVLAIAFGVVAIGAQQSAGAIPVGEPYGPIARLAIGCYGLGYYVVKTVAPWGLAALYPYPPAATSAPPPGAYAAIAAVVAAAGLIVASRNRFRALALGAGFYLATVALVLQIVPVGGALAADRYSYLPAVGLSVALAAVLTRLAFRRAIAVVVIAVSVLLAGATWARCGVWHDAMSLWNDVLAKQPNAALAYQNRGVAKAAAGDHRGAIADYDAAIRLSPSYADAWANRGGSKADLGDPDGALTDLQEAVRIDPRRATYRFNLGLVLGDKGRWDEALASLSEAIQLKPDFAAAYLNRGLALAQVGRTAEGAVDVKRAKALGYPVGPDLLRRFE